MNLPNKKCTTILKTFFFTFLFLSAFIVWGKFSAGIETSVYSLLGGDGFLSRLATNSSSFVRVLCTDSARAEKCKEVFEFVPPVDFEKMRETVRTKGRGLLAPKSRLLLEQNETNKIARSAMRRDYSGMGMFPKADDPYYFLTDFVLSLKEFDYSPSVGDAQVLTGICSEKSSGESLKRLIDLAKDDDGIFLSGAPFHTILTTEKTKHEINLLGIVSIFLVLLCGFGLFRNFRFVLPVLLALSSGFLVGCAVLCLFSSKPHALTFLFGTTLIGLGVDYCYHALCEERSRKTFLKLTYALVSTCLSFSPILFSRVAVLREMAIFTIAGLTAIYVYARLFLPTLKNNAVANQPFVLEKVTCLRKVLFGVFIVLLAGSWMTGFSFDANPSNFYSPDSVLERGEKEFAKQFGEGSGVFAIVPLGEWQKKNAVLKEKSGKIPGGFLEAGDLPSFMTIECDGIDYLILPASFADSECKTICMKDELQDLFQKLSRETMVLLGAGAFVFVVISAFIFRRRFLHVMTPLFLSVLSTAFLLAVLKQPFHFFQMLCFFVLLGIGIDYSVFHAEAADGPAKRIVFFSFLTSFVGFGSLSFTSFAVTKSMGLTLSFGLLFAYLFSFALSLRKNEIVASGHWAVCKEQSAGKIRILLLWHAYRLLGKDVSKALFFPAFVAMYPFCKTARKALGEYYAVAKVVPRPFYHLLSFAWSVFDKTDACSLCKNPPVMHLSGDEGWMRGGAFLLTSHLGCSEVLPALRFCKERKATPKVHAFQQLGHNAVFTKIFMNKLDPEKVVLHDVGEIGVETAVEMKESINRGDLVVMAADRLSANSSKTLSHVFFGRNCLWPKGVFKFALLMECPVYALACVKTGRNSYTVVSELLNRDSLLSSYVTFLESEVKKHPYQWYQFYSFFHQHPAS